MRTEKSNPPLSPLPELRKRRVPIGQTARPVPTPHNPELDRRRSGAGLAGPYDHPHEVEPLAGLVTPSPHPEGIPKPTNGKTHRRRWVPVPCSETG